MSERATIPWLAKLAATLCWSSLVGLGVTVHEIQKAFSVLEKQGIGDPAELSQAIGGVLWSSAIGTVFGLIGFIIALWYLIWKRMRSIWLMVSAIVAGLVLAYTSMRAIRMLTHFSEPPRAANEEYR